VHCSKSKYRNGLVTVRATDITIHLSSITPKFTRTCRCKSAKFLLHILHNVQKFVKFNSKLFFFCLSTKSVILQFYILALITSISLKEKVVPPSVWVCGWYLNISYIEALAATALVLVLLALVAMVVVVVVLAAAELVINLVVTQL